MKFKYVLLILLLICCCGCSVDYKLDIDNNLNYSENINISASNDDDIRSISEYDDIVPVDIDVDDYKSFVEIDDKLDYYNIIKSDDNKNIDIDYVYDINSFVRNRAALTCFDSVGSVINKDDELLLVTSKGFLCFDKFDDLDSVKVTIKTKMDVISNNASLVVGNNYIWNIDKDNKDDIYISMVIDASSRDDLSFWEEHMMFIVMIGILILGICIYFMIRKRSHRVNKI